jgi:hypothetical protein
MEDKTDTIRSFAFLRSPACAVIGFVGGAVEGFFVALFEEIWEE